METTKKQAFAMAIVCGLTKRNAAIAAGYSVKTASAAGTRLAKDEDVLQEIERLRNLSPSEAAEVFGVPIDGVAAAAKTAAPAADSAAMPSAASEAEAEVGEAETLDRIALAARQRAVVNGTKIELDGVVYDQRDPKDQLTLCQLGVISLNRQQIESAKTLMPYHYGKVADQGKKGAEAEAARAAAKGRFGTMAPPPTPAQGGLWPQ